MNKSFQWAFCLFLSIFVFTFFACESTPSNPPPAATSTAAAASASDNANANRARDLVQGEMGVTPSPSASPGATAKASAAASPAASENPDLNAPVLTDQEKKYMENYINNLHFMVYYTDKPGIDPDVAKAAVNSANRYLVEKEKLDVIDFEQIEKNKADQQDAYIAETGGSIDMVQYLAQKLNADIYVEIDMSISSQLKDSRWMSTAIITMKLFETSTASLLGSINKQSNSPSFIPNATDAKPSATNAATSTVSELMPKMLAQAKELMKKSNSMGIKHEIIIQNTSDTKLMSQFRKKLGSKVKSIETISSSAKETKYLVYIVGKTDTLEDIIIAAAEAVPGLENMYLVYRRGKSFTFNTGN